MPRWKTENGGGSIARWRVQLRADAEFRARVAPDPRSLLGRVPAVASPNRAARRLELLNAGDPIEVYGFEIPEYVELGDRRGVFVLHPDDKLERAPVERLREVVVDDGSQSHDRHRNE